MFSHALRSLCCSVYALWKSPPPSPYKQGESTERCYVKFSNLHVSLNDPNGASHGKRWQKYRKEIYVWRKTWPVLQTLMQGFGLVIRWIIRWQDQIYLIAGKSIDLSIVTIYYVCHGHYYTWCSIAVSGHFDMLSQHAMFQIKMVLLWSYVYQGKGDLLQILIQVFCWVIHWIIHWQEPIYIS